MAGTREIKNRISSVKDTQKITNAMYLIASTKLRKAKRDWDQTQPYFKAVQAEIKRMFRTVKDLDSQFFFPIDGKSEELPGAYGYLVITADKGLAGAYNQNVLRLAQKQMEEHDENMLFVVGEYGRQYFNSHHIPIEKSFLHTAQNPTLQRARDICQLLLERYQKGELRKIFVIYTDFGNGLEPKACSVRLLPFHREQFADTVEKEIKRPFEFTPGVEQVLDTIVPSYITGFIYSALVDSFCSEQNARMTAMDSANQNAQALLEELSTQFNHARQSAITQEITEISAGAVGQRRYQQQLKGDQQP